MVKTMAVHVDSVGAVENVLMSNMDHRPETTFTNEPQCITRSRRAFCLCFSFYLLILIEVQLQKKTGIKTTVQQVLWLNGRSWRQPPPPWTHLHNIFIHGRT